MNKKTNLEGLEKGRAAYLEKLKNGEIERLDPIARSKKNPNSMRMAINANCYDCMGRENWITRTKFCTLFDCPFWTMRKGGKGVTVEDCKKEKVN